MGEKFADIKHVLQQSGVLIDPFDVIKIVDAEKGVLLEYEADGTLRVTEICCTQVFGHEDRCENCTSSRAYSNSKSLSY